MDPVLAGAFIDNSGSNKSGTRILGVRLRKFCLWHRFLLKAVNSPFLGGQPITLFDVRVAVGICRNKPYNSKIRKPWVIPILVYLRIGLTAIFSSRKKRRLERESNKNALQRILERYVLSFVQYAEDYLQAPEYAVVPPPRVSGQPPIESRGTFDDTIEHVGELIRWGIPEYRAWSMPIGMANVYRIIARRNAGYDIDIVTEEEKEFQKIVPAEFRHKRK